MVSVGLVEVVAMERLGVQVHPTLHASRQQARASTSTSTSTKRGLLESGLQ